MDPNSLKVRIPKAGAYIDPANKVPIPTLPANVKEPIVGLKLKVSNGKIVKLVHDHIVFLMGFFIG